VDFHNRRPDSSDRVGNGTGSVSQRSWVEDDAVSLESLDQLHDASLAVGLLGLHLHSHLHSPGLHSIDEIFEGGRPIDLRLPDAEEVEIGSVEDEEAHQATLGR
jgi:hypothetical protein